MKQIIMVSDKTSRRKVMKTKTSVEVPVLTIQHYSRTPRTLNKKRKMVIECLNEASIRIENELKTRYD